MKSFEGCRKKNTDWVQESTEEVWTIETVDNGNMVKKDLYNPSSTFRVRISKSYIYCHSKWNLLKVESREKNTGWAQESTEEV